MALKAITLRINERVSELFNSLYSSSTAAHNQSEMFEMCVKFFAENEKNFEQLQGLEKEVEALQNDLQAKDKQISDLSSNDRSEELQSKDNQIRSLTEELESIQKVLASISEEKELLTGQLKELKESQSKAIIIKETSLFNAIVAECCKMETARTGKTITPAMLLVSMFNNYVVKGELFLFNCPSYGRIKQIAKEYSNEQ